MRNEKREKKNGKKKCNKKYLTSYLFSTILKILKQNDFEIEDGVDSAEVSAFVDWVESTDRVPQIVCFSKLACDSID
jgi:hypothetical protein